jgi:hypothetical protein
MSKLSRLNSPVNKKIDKKKSSGKFFKVAEWWEKEWQGMPEFVKKDLNSFKHIIVHFANKDDMEEFSKLVNQRLTIKTKSIWYPKADRMQFGNQRYIDES